MRKLQVFTARVNVDHVAAEELGRHDRALDMPTGVARAPRRIPFHDVKRIGLPEHKVCRMLLDRLVLVGDSSACSGFELFQRISAQASVRWETFHAEIDDAVTCNVCVSAVDQTFDHCLHAFDVIGGFGHDAGGVFERHFVTEFARVFQKGLGIEVGDLVRIIRIVNDDAIRQLVCLFVIFELLDRCLHFVFTRTVSHFVVRHMPDVRDVHDVMNFVTREFQEPPQQVTKQERSKVADMGKVVNGWTATVHFDLARFDRFELFDAFCE